MLYWVVFVARFPAEQETVSCNFMKIIKILLISALGIIVSMGTAVAGSDDDYALYQAQRAALEKQFAPEKAKCIATQDPPAVQFMETPAASCYKVLSSTGNLTTCRAGAPAPATLAMPQEQGAVVHSKVPLIQQMAATQTSKPSFNCAFARTVVEGMICGNPKLSALDSKLSSLYQAKLKSGADATVLRSSQRDWIRLRNDCGARLSCLEQSYKSRISQLQ